jgi:hypothetical protein
MKASNISMLPIFPAFEVTSASNQGAFFAYSPETVYSITFFAVFAIPKVRRPTCGLPTCSSIALTTQYVNKAATISSDGTDFFKQKPF